MPELRAYQLELVERIKQAWQAGFKAPCVVLGCGGGKSCILAEIARKTAWNGKNVLVLVHRQELVEQIFKTFVQWEVNMTYCRIGMVQTITRRLKTIPAPALIITDENHHSLATSYKRIYDYFPTAKRIGVTATPIRLNGDGLGDVNDKLVVGKSTKWLIENNYLSQYDYYAPNIADLTGLHTKRGEYIAEEINKAMIKKAVFGDVIKYYNQLANGKKAICYCSSIKHSIATAAALKSAGINAVHIDGDTPNQERKDIVDKFRNGEVTILCNVDLISEGFDVPDCECAILLRPTQSLPLYIQQSMRCMRYQKGKKAVIIDHVGNYARFGMPDDDRTWTLEKKDQKAKIKEPEKNKIELCPECFFTFMPKVDEKKVCPHCGYVFPIKGRSELENKDRTELTKITGFSLNLKTVDDCNTYSELKDYAKQHGYKQGWCYYQAKKKGIIS